MSIKLRDMLSGFQLSSVLLCVESCNVSSTAYFGMCGTTMRDCVMHDKTRRDDAVHDNTARGNTMRDNSMCDPFLLLDLVSRRRRPGAL